MAVAESRIAEKTAQVEAPKFDFAVESRTTPRPSLVSVKNVLFATDFSATSDAALPYAAAICRRFGATLHLVHVVPETDVLLMTGGVDYVGVGMLYEEALNEAKTKLEEFAAPFAEIPHRNYVRRGRIWDVLAGIIEAREIDLIVLGTHGRTGLGKLLLGSVAEEILHRALCPVLTIGPNISGRAKLPALPATARDLAPVELDLRQIVLATTLADNPEALGRAAAKLAAEFGARLTLAHVTENYNQKDPGAIAIRIRCLRSAVPLDIRLPYPPEPVVEFGGTWGRILKIAADRDADLIVLGARPADEAGSTHLPWSTAHHVIAHAICPVLTIRR
jgi:nucleotide-binding universal stress UspA family protein